MTAPLGGPGTPKTRSLHTRRRIPSGHQYESTTLCGLWALRTQSSDHSTVALGCTKGHVQSPARLPLRQARATTVDTWLETSTCLSTRGRPQCLGLCTGCLVCLLLSRQLPLCVTCPWHYWLTGEVFPNNSGVVERHKRAWVTDSFWGCPSAHDTNPFCWRNVSDTVPGWSHSLKRAGCFIFSQTWSFLSF